MIEVNKDVGRPEELVKLFSRNDLPRAIEENAQHLQLLHSEPDSNPVPAELASLRVKLKNAKPKKTGRRRDRHP